MIKIEKNEELFLLHKEAICERLLLLIDQIISDCVQLKINKDCLIYITPKIRTLLKYIKLELDDFVTSNISKQRLLINKMQLKDATLINKKGKDYSDSYNVIKYIFVTKGYDVFRDGFIFNNNKYDAYTFVEYLNLKTCPYCNRNYISILQKVEGDNTTKKRRPELDHFYPKSLYPFLAINFYNLIPSCSTCNRLKSNDDALSLLNPYSTKVRSIKFTYWLNNMKFYYVKSLDDITFESEKSIEIEIENLPSANNNVFQMERLYQDHTDIVIELILKYTHYPESYVKELADFGYTKEEVYRFVFSNYLNESNLSKKPLSRLTRDIADELTLLDYFDEIKEG